MTTATARRALDDYRTAAVRLRLTVLEDAPADPPRPVQELGDLVVELEALAELDDPHEVRRRAHVLLLQAQAWPLAVDLGAVARERGAQWTTWLDTVWWGLRNLGAATGHLDEHLTTEQGRERGRR